MNFKEGIKNSWIFLKKDTWPSYIVSIILIIILIKFIIFPFLSLITSTPLPLVVVESCSMYHNTNFENWWKTNAAWYDTHEVPKTDFQDFPFRNGLNKGDIIIVWGRSEYKQGDVIIFTAPTRYPIIHRLIQEQPKATKGDNNIDQLDIENSINEDAVIGKAILRIPYLGWIKLAFFEPRKSADDRGFC